MTTSGADEDLVYLTAGEALARFRARSLSPVELMTATIARAEAVEPAINAFSWRFFEPAMAAAREAEQRYAGKGGAPRPLEGLPVAIKEETPVAGQPWTQGSLIYKDRIAEHTGLSVQRVIDAGAIVHARTTNPEFSCAGFTHSRLFGVTRNPWNLAFDPGGSTGGGAAALASGTTMLTTGSDIGGSLRIPASCCGIVGYKPPYGRVPYSSPGNLDHYLMAGPMARTVGDCALIQNVMAGPHPHDIVSLRDNVAIPENHADIRGWKIAYSLDLDGREVDPEIRANTLAVVEALRDAGAGVDEVTIGWDWREINEAFATHFLVNSSDREADFPEEQFALLTSYAAAYFAPVPPLPASQGTRGLELEGKIYARLGDVLERYQALICPTLTIPAVPAGYTPDRPTFDFDDWSMAGLDFSLTAPFNICGRCPVLAVPSGFAGNGVPTGVQIVGRTYRDLDVFAVGAALERARPWLDNPARRPAIGDA